MAGREDGGAHPADGGSDRASDRVLSLGLLVLFAAIGLLAAADLGTDLSSGTTLGHVALEGGVALTALAGALWMALRVRAFARAARALRAEADALQVRLAGSEKDAERWRAEARDLIQGLSGAIDRQLDAWALSPAEKDVALLLLKGLSHKEVADLRGVSEATVRQQARALYKKAGLSGRADLAAFFLEDLLGPRATDDRSPAAREGR